VSGEQKVNTHAVYTAVWAVNFQPAGVKLVALAYAKFADPDGSNVYPGRARIMRMTGYGEDFVRDATVCLKKLGVLKETRKATYTTPAEYRIDLDVLAELAEADEVVKDSRERKLTENEKAGGRAPRRADDQQGASSRGRGARVVKGGGRAPTQPSRHPPGQAKGEGARPPAGAGGSPRQKNWLKVVRP
jgi:hypothetical protein